MIPYIPKWTTLLNLDMNRCHLNENVMILKRLLIREMMQSRVRRDVSAQKITGIKAIGMRFERVTAEFDFFSISLRRYYLLFSLWMFHHWYFLDFLFFYYVSFIFFMNAQREIRVNAFRLRFERMAAECDYLFYIITSLSLPWFFWMSHHRHFFDVLFFFIASFISFVIAQGKIFINAFRYWLERTAAEFGYLRISLRHHHFLGSYESSIIGISLIFSLLLWFVSSVRRMKTHGCQIWFFFFCMITSLLLY